MSPTEKYFHVPGVTSPAGHADKRRSRFLRNGRERRHELLGRMKAEKVGSLPPNLVFFFCVTFLFLVSFISSFSPGFCGSRSEEDGEDEAEVRNSYLLHLFRRNSHCAHREKFLVGLERPTSHFGHGSVCESRVAPAQHRCLPASKLIVAPCATSCSLDTCSIAKVTARVTHMVIWVFHTHFTFPRCE